MRGLLALAASLGMALSALGLAIAAPGGGPEAEQGAIGLRAATGAVHVINSREGRAILGAGAMRPGDTVTGGVAIGNGGAVGVRLSLRPGTPQEVTGPGGGRLSEALQVAVADVTDGARPLTLYAGPLAALRQLAAGTLPRGATREYRVTATLVLPPGDDNRFQGASLSLPLEWGADAVPVAPTPSPTPPPPAPKPVAPKPPAPPAADPADVLGLPAAGACVRGRRLRLRLKPPGGVRLVSATVAVNGKAKAKLKAPKVHARLTLRKLPKRTVKLAVTARGADRRTYKAARTYAACR